MKDFDSWYIMLIEDERWHEQASMNHAPKTFEETARKVYVQGLADASSFSIIPISEHRKHVYNKVSKLPHDKPKKNWITEALKKHEVEQKKAEPPPLTGEQRAMKLNEWYEAVQKATINSAVAPISHKEIMENGDWRPKPVTIREPSEVEKRAALNAHIEKINTARRKMFTDAFPDAQEDEIQAYLDKFKTI